MNLPTKSPLALRIRFLLFGIAMSLVASSTTGCDRGEPHRVVLITLDTLRLDALISSDGSTAQTSMPRTAAFAAEGQSFVQFFASCSQTQPTHASLLTGLHPWEHGVSRNGMVLGSELRTLAETYRQAGYETRAVVASFPLHRRFGFDQGFEEYSDEFDLGSASETDKSWNQVNIDGNKFYSLCEATTDRAIRAIRESTSPRQFFWFHYYDPHSPYGDASQAKSTERLPRLLRQAAANEEGFPDSLIRAQKLYGDDVTALDNAVARLLAFLEENNANLPTHVALTSDHGESFGEDGSLGHARRVTRPQTQVPFVLHGPGIKPRLRTDTASSIDVAATLLALGGLEGLGNSGRNLLALDSPEPAPLAFGMRRSFSPTPSDTETLAHPVDLRRINGTWKKIELLGNEFFAVRNGVLYSGNEHEVRCEDTPDLGLDQEIASWLRDRFRQFDTELSQTEAFELTDRETETALRNLGYLREGDAPSSKNND